MLARGSRPDQVRLLLQQTLERREVARDDRLGRRLEGGDCRIPRAQRLDVLQGEFAQLGKPWTRAITN